MSNLTSLSIIVYDFAFNLTLSTGTLDHVYNKQTACLTISDFFFCPVCIAIFFYLCVWFFLYLVLSVKSACTFNRDMIVKDFNSEFVLILMEVKK